MTTLSTDKQDLIEEVRTTLGKRADKYTDIELQEQIIHFQLLVEYCLDTYERNQFDRTTIEIQKSL